MQMSELKKARRSLWLFGIFKIPLIGFTRPKLIELSDQRMVMMIPLRRRTKNHLGSMYFGALAIGADLSGAFQAFFIAEKSKKKMSIVFKDFKANFISRPENNVFFISEDGEIIQDIISETIASKERVTKDIKINAYTHYPENPVHVAEFTLGLSIKSKSN
jgi:hypothetical protein